MPSEFDLLIDDLRAVQNGRPPRPLMAKAMSRPPTMATFAGLKAALLGWPGKDKDLTAMVTDLQAMTAGMAKRPAAHREKTSPAQFFKALGEARTLVGRNIAAGKISADAAIRAEMKLNAMYAKAVDIAAAKAARP